MAKVSVLLHTGKIKKMSEQHAKIFVRLGKGIIYTPEIEHRPKAVIIQKAVVIEQPDVIHDEPEVSQDEESGVADEVEKSSVDAEEEQPKKRRGRPKKEEVFE